MTVTIQQIKRLQQDFEKLAKEVIEVECLGSTFYAWGSELACLRLAYAYRFSGDKVKCGQQNGKYYFRLETTF